MCHIMTGIQDSAFSIQYISSCSHLDKADHNSDRLLLVLDKDSPFKAKSPSFTAIIPLSETTILQNRYFPAYVIAVNDTLIRRQWDMLGVTSPFSWSCCSEKRLTKKQSDILSYLFQKILYFPADGSFTPPLMQYSWLYESLCTARDIFQTDFPAAPCSHKAEDTIGRIISYISENYMENISVNELSLTFYISKYHLMREFKKVTGCTIHTFLLNQRISHAQQMIAKGIQAGTASTLVGFSDYSLFYRSFLKLTGTSPKEYSSFFDPVPLTKEL